MRLTSVDLSIELTVMVSREVAEIPSEQELVLGFACGACGDAEKTCEVLFAVSAAALGDIRGNRGGGPAELDREPETLLSGEALSAAVNFQRELMGLLPDLDLFIAIARGEYRISGFRNRDLQRPLQRNSGQVSRLLRRLRVHGLIKKVARTYKYYLTRLGSSVVACALRLRDQTVAPALANG